MIWGLLIWLVPGTMWAELAWWGARGDKLPMSRGAYVYLLLLWPVALYNIFVRNKGV